MVYLGANAYDYDHEFLLYIKFDVFVKMILTNFLPEKFQYYIRPSYQGNIENQIRNFVQNMKL